MDIAVVHGNLHVYLVMQEVLGHTLGSWVAAKGRLPLSDAVAITTHILRDVGKTLARVGRTHFHRDCSPRNCLVVDGPEGPQCWLIDFGAAVEATAWRAEWAQRTPAGDVRYWPPASWVRFLRSPAALVHAGPAWVDQYVTQLDDYALGIMGVEVLCSLLPEQPQFAALQAAWRAYEDLTHQAWVQCHVFSVKHVFGAGAAGDRTTPALAEWNKLLGLQVPPRLTELAKHLQWQLAKASKAAPVCEVIRRLITAEDGLRCSNLSAAMHAQRLQERASSAVDTNRPARESPPSMLCPPRC